MRIDEQAARFRRTRRDQEGAFSTVQAREAGYSPAAVAAKVARGEWVPEAHGVLRAAHHPATPRTRIRVATERFARNVVEALAARRATSTI